MSDNTPSSKPPQPAFSVIELEEKLMYQQRTLDEFSGVVLLQQSELDRLGRELQSLRTLVQQLIEHGSGEDLPHEKPPHY